MPTNSRLRVVGVTNIDVFSEDAVVGSVTVWFLLYVKLEPQEITHTPHA